MCKYVYFGVQACYRNAVWTILSLCDAYVRKQQEQRYMSGVNIAFGERNAAKNNTHTIFPRGTMYLAQTHTPVSMCVAPIVDFVLAVFLVSTRKRLTRKLALTFQTRVATRFPWGTKACRAKNKGGSTQPTTGLVRIRRSPLECTTPLKYKFDHM